MVKAKGSFHVRYDGSGQFSIPKSLAEVLPWIHKQKVLIELKGGVFTITEL